MSKKPVRFTRHAVARILSLDFTEDDVLKAINRGERQAEGKSKFKTTLRLKGGLLVATCSDYPDHILVITVGRGGERKK